MKIVTPEGYLLNPLNPIYHDDTEISSLPEIRGVLAYATDLEELIEGDFDIQSATEEFFTNQYAFIRNGLLLSRIKFLKVYKQIEDCTFERFCTDFLHKTRWQINDTIKAARVCIKLISLGFDIIPTNISQAIALADLEEEELYRGWKEIIEEYSPDKITAKLIRRRLFPPTVDDKPRSRIEIPATLHEEIYETASRNKLSITNLLRTMLYFFLTGSKKVENSHLLLSENNTENYTQIKPSKEEDIRNFGGVVPY